MPKEILVLKHIGIEGPGSIEEFFQNTAWDLQIIDLNTEQLRSKDVRDIAAIISLGGPMNVYEENKYPFLRDENELLKKAIKKEIPILGICLGAQLLAKACGAKVKKAKQKEIGWHKVNLTEAGKQDALFTGLSSQLNVFQWHEDIFEIPKGALHLAESPICPKQAFRFGRNAYGVQFHVEVTPEMIESWIYAYRKNETLETKDMLIESYKKKETFRKQADIIYFNFARVITESQKIRVD